MEEFSVSQLFLPLGIYSGSKPVKLLGEIFIDTYKFGSEAPNYACAERNTELAAVAAQSGDKAMHEFAETIGAAILNQAQPKYQVSALALCL